VAAPRLTPEDQRSLGFGEAIAERLDDDADGTLIARSREMLDRMRVLDDESGSHARRLFRVWEALLDLGPAACAEMLRSRSQLAQQLRSASPFAGILTNAERTAVILRTRPR
jgi:hypothetical protein